MKDMERVSEYLSVGDLFLKEWTHGGKISLSKDKILMNQNFSI